MSSGDTEFFEDFALKSEKWAIIGRRLWELTSLGYALSEAKILKMDLKNPHYFEMLKQDLGNFSIEPHLSFDLR